MRRTLLGVLFLWEAVGSFVAMSEEAPIYRLYDDLALFFVHAKGGSFVLRLTVRDLNRLACGPSELMVHLYDPQGRLILREVLPDDGVNPRNGGPTLAGWDHVAWYYETCYSRGLDPLVRWSILDRPDRIAALPERQWTFRLSDAPPGVYRLVLAGSSDLLVQVQTDPVSPFGSNGGPDWRHGSGDQFRRHFLCVPKGASGLSLGLLELDRPRGRACALRTLEGKPLVLRRVHRDRGGAVTGESPVEMTLDGRGGYTTVTGEFPAPAAFEGQILVFEVEPGSNDYLFAVDFLFPREQRNWRGAPRVSAVLCGDPETARAIQNGAWVRGGELFWNGYALRLWEWLQGIPPDEMTLPAGLPQRKDFVSVGSHETPMRRFTDSTLREPRPGAADVIMESYDLHQDRRALMAAIREMLEGMRLIGPNDHVMHGRNLAYEMGCYSFFYHRPAGRILQQTDAPDEAKGPIREFAIQIGDRLAFCRGIELVNGNSLASLVQGLRYLVEATDDRLLRHLFDVYWDRFAHGGFGDRVGIGPSGGIQEGYGYDMHYGTYVLSGWRAVLRDLGDERFRAAYDRIHTLYSYVASQGDTAAPWSSRTHLAPARYNPDQEGPYRWKGYGGPSFTLSVNEGREFFAARRPGYYAVTYHGRITPTWLGEGFHGQIGYSGGILCQLHIPGKGQVLASTLNGDYGAGMHVSQWRNFHLHALVGETADGLPFVSANSEHPEARLEGTTVVSAGEIRQSSLAVERRYEFGEAEIGCAVRLSRSSSDRIFGIYGGLSRLRGMVREAWEMIPFTFVTTSAGRGKPAVVKTQVLGTDEEGEERGSLDDQPARASAVRVDQGGYGVRIVFDMPRPVRRGQNRTIMVELVPRGEGAVPAETVAFAYRLCPYAEGSEPGAAATSPASSRRAAIMLPRLTLEGHLDDRLPGQLTEAPSVTLETGGVRRAVIRIAAVKAGLALLAEVVEAKLVRAETVWKGSCIELFGAPEAGGRIGQVFLVPAVGSKPAEAFVAQGTQQVAAPDIAVASAPTERGYRLWAVIPWPRLGVPENPSRFALEFQVTAAGPDGQRTPLTAFGSRLAYQNSTHYAPVEVNP